MRRQILIWYWSKSGGGGSQFAVNLGEQLAAEFGPDGITLSLHADDHLVKRARARGLRTLTAEIFSDRERPLATALELWRAARVLGDHAASADLIIVPMNFALAAPLSLMLKAPLVYCAHDPAPHPGDHARGWQRATQAILIRRARRVVALSEYSAALLRRMRHAPPKLAVAPLSSVFAPSVGRPNETRAPVRLLFAGRMIAYKGLDLLADALDLIGDRSDWRLTIAGAGPALDAAALSRLQRAQVETVENAWMTEDRLRELIADCDVVLAPYTSATQSGIVSQALALGRPCIVTPVGGLSEQIGDGIGGWVAEAPTALALAAAIAVALDAPGAVAARAEAAARLAQRAWSGRHWSWVATV